MTSTTADSQPTLSFPDASTLDLIIPNSSDFDVENHLRSDNQLVSRDNLFFGMHLVPFSILVLLLISIRGIAACICCPSQLVTVVSRSNRQCRAVHNRICYPALTTSAPAIRRRCSSSTAAYKIGFGLGHYYARTQTGSYSSS